MTVSLSLPRQIVPQQCSSHVWLFSPGATEWALSCQLSESDVGIRWSLLKGFLFFLIVLWKLLWFGQASHVSCYQTLALQEDLDLLNLKVPIPRYEHTLLQVKILHLNTWKYYQQNVWKVKLLCKDVKWQVRQMLVLTKDKLIAESLNLLSFALCFSSHLVHVFPDICFDYMCNQAAHKLCFAFCL